jgi:hypothetical protein
MQVAFPDSSLCVLFRSVDEHEQGYLLPDACSMCVHALVYVMRICVHMV